MEEQHLHRPLLAVENTASAPSSATSCIIQRILLVVFVGVISIWANNEASKGFEIRVINDMKGTPVGDKFSLFYVSNDEATRLVQRAAASATKMLYSDGSSMPEKIIDRVDVRLGRDNFTNDYVVVTKSSAEKNEFVIILSPLIMEFGDFRYRVRKEIHRGIAEVLLFDKQDRAPKTLINGLTEYMSNLEGFDGLNLVFRSRNCSGKCWDDEDPEVVSRFLGHSEGRSEGFIGRLYQEMGKDDWDDHAVDKALGTTATPLCESSHSPIVQNEVLVATE